MNQPVDPGENRGDDTDSRVEQRERRAQLWDDLLRWGIPRYPLWVRCFAFAFFGWPIGLVPLIIGVATGDAGATVLGSVVMCLVLAALVAGIRLKRRDQAVSAVPPAHPLRVRSKGRGR